MDAHDEYLLEQHRRSLATIQTLKQKERDEAIVYIDVEPLPRPTFWLRAEIHEESRIAGTPRTYAIVCYNNECWEIEYARLVKLDRPWLYLKSPIGSAATAEVFALISSWAQRFLHPAEDGMDAFDRWRRSMLRNGEAISTKAYGVHELAAFHAGGEAYRLGRDVAENPFKDRLGEPGDMAGHWLRGFIAAKDPRV